MSTTEKNYREQIEFDAVANCLDLFDEFDEIENDGSWSETRENLASQNKTTENSDKKNKQDENEEKMAERITDSQCSVKLEFSCSPERILEPNMDYSLDNVVEVCSTSDSDDDNCEGIDCMVRKTLNVSGDNGIIQLNSSLEDEENSELSNVMNDHNYTLQESSKVSLPSPELIPASLPLHELTKESLRIHEDVIAKATSEKSASENQLESNEDRNVDEESNHSRSTVSEDEQIDYLEFYNRLEQKKEASPNDKILKKLKVEPRSDVNFTEQELFVQNVINAVAEEDAAEETSLLESPHKDPKSQKTSENESSQQNVLNSELGLQTASVSEAPHSEASVTDSFSSYCDNNKSPTHDANAETNKEQESKRTTETENLMQEADTNTSDSENSSINNLALPDNCSEPLEFATFESRFEHLNTVIEEVESSCSTLPLLKEFTTLVNDMHKDCTSFATATNNIESRLKCYILEKFKVIRDLNRRINNGFATEIEQQTDPKISRKRLRKLNKKNKADLLASSDTSSESDSSSSSPSSDELENFPHDIQKSQQQNSDIDAKDNAKSEASLAKICLLRNIELNDDQHEKISQCSTLYSEALYDDGIVMSKYLRSDVFSLPHTTKRGNGSRASTPRKHRQSSSPSSTSSANGFSSDDNESNVKTNKLRKKSKKKSGKHDNDVDDNDKEIERLINLDGLMKRHNNVPSLKQSDVDKSSSKSQTQKTKTDGVLEFLEKDLSKDSSSSDDSLNENEEEVITERQYLERRNQDVKNQLLNDSSNDTSQEDESNDDFEAPLSNESDTENLSPLVDKFLKVYKVDDSEEVDNEDDASVEETTENKDEISTTAPTDETHKAIEIASEDETAKKKVENVENNAPNSPENSDCELLNDNFNYRKRSQPKSLEKILNDAEKRKKLQKLDEDLISLSSESDCSDVEAVDVEPADSTKSRAIKAMLRPDQLHRETLKAQKNESDRLRRLEKRQNMLSKVLEEHPEMKADEELVLDYNEETKTFIKVHAELVKNLKPHQRDGVRFMYESCYGSVDTVKKNNGSGCILAHCMGLGKTLQLITLMHTVISYKELNTSKVLVLCPKSTVMNWGDEIFRWLMPLRTKKLKVYTFNDTSDIKEKLSIMREWSESTHQKAGCLLIGYEAFRTLVFYHKYKIRNNLDSKQVEKIRDMIDSYLLQPGADLVVCDEGHIIKNSKSAISLAVAEIKTQKRIVLTGTPIQNNLKEYYSMVNFIKPLFLGTEKEFANLYANPIKNGQHKDSSKRDIKVMKQRSFVLHKKLSKFVQRKEAELLMSFLPKKFEYVLFIPMTDVQNKLYERILESIKSRDDHRGRSLITDYTCLRKIWTHPKVLEDAWKNAKNLQFKRDARKQPNSDDDQPDDIYDSQTGFMSVKNDWWRSLIAETDLESILPSNKLRTMFEILRMCEENGEKCLIFSAFVAVLNVVEYFFQKLSKGDKETLKELNIPQGVRPSWEPNKDYFRLDGKTSKSTRHEMIKRFNLTQNTRARVFLISAKAGGQGINLIGANRVIILDTSWNPSNDQQNIFRIFRLGQKKNCYIYRLLAQGTMEEKVYSRSVTKQAMSFRVMDVQQIDRHYSMAELAELYTLTIPIFSERPTPVFPQDNILANLLRSFPDLVYKYHEHNSLLENKVEQELSEQEKIDAWAAYEQDLQLNSQLSQMPNPEDLQNRLSQGPLQNYGLQSSSFPGFNMQSLVNYRGMPSQMNAGYMNPMLSQYANLTNQQFLEAVNTFRQYGQPNESAYNAMIANTYSMLTGMPPPTSSVGTSHNTSGGSITANPVAPINALSELARYGLGMNSGTNSVLSSATANVNSLYGAAGMPSASAAMFSGSPTYYESYHNALKQLSGSSAAMGLSPLNTLTNSAAFQTPRRTPPQMGSRKSSTPDMTVYRTSGMGNGATTPTSVSNMAAATMQSNTNDLPRFANNPNFNATNTPNVNLSSDISTTSVRKGDTGAIGRGTSKSTVPTSNANTTVNTSTSRTSATVSTSQHRTTPVSSTAKPPPIATTNPTSKTTGKPLTSTTASLPTMLTSSSTTVTSKSTDPQIRVRNMDQLYANGGRVTPLKSTAGPKEVSGSNFAGNNTPTSTSTTVNPTLNRNKQAIDNRLLNTATTAAAAELLKARSEMQIIPTTSPPGTASISKQLSEISPSISLTAVHTNTTQKSSSNNNNVHSTISKSSVANTTSTSRNVSNNRMTVTTTTTTPANRQQIVSSSTQQRKAPTAGANNNITNLLTYSRKSATVPITNTTSITPSPIITTPAVNLNPKKPVKLSNQFTTASNIINSNSTKSGQGVAAMAATNTSTTVTPTLPSTITATTKSVSSVLRQHHIRKMPSPVPPLNLPGSNTSTVSNQSTTVATSVNTKSGYAIASKSATPTAATNNAAQYFYNKNGTAHKRSFSPTISTTGAGSLPISMSTSSTLASRPAVPMNVTPATTTISRKQPFNNGVVVTKSKPSRISPSAGLATLPTTSSTPTATTTKTTAFPVHLQRGNTTVQVTRPLSKPAASGIGNRSQSAGSIVTPKISSVASLNTTPMTTAATGNLVANPVVTAARVAAFKKTAGKLNTTVQLGKQAQEKRYTMPASNTGTTSSLTSNSAMKTAVATAVAQQRSNTATGTGRPLMQQMVQQTSMQRVPTTANNGGVGVPSSSTSRITGGVQIGGVNVRNMIKGSMLGNTNVVGMKANDKRITVANNSSISKILLERKRKGSEMISKDISNPNKRPKDF